MELRKKQEGRQLDTVKVTLRQVEKQQIERRQDRSSDRQSSNIGEKKNPVRERTGWSGVHASSKNKMASPLITSRWFTAVQKKKWKTYSDAQKRQKLMQAELAAHRRIASKGQEKNVSNLAAIASDPISQIRKRYQIDEWKLPDRRKNEKEHGKEENRNFQSIYKKVEADHSNAYENFLEKRKSAQQEAKQKKKWDKAYAAELIRLMESDLKKEDWIKEQQRKDEITLQQIEYSTGMAAIRTVTLPIRVSVAVLREKVQAAIRQASAKLLKYTAAAAIPLVTALLLLLFVASVLSGIAGEEEQQGYAASGYEIVAYAEEWIGVTKYIWGAGRGSATAWQSYADCSSFVHGVFAYFGYEIGGDTYAQEHAGTLVTGGLSAALPGDIILFFSGSIGAGRSSHVGIYAGDGRMIHCSGGRSNVSPATAGRGVCWGSPTGDGRPFQVRRIVQEISGAAGNASSGHRKDTTSYTQSQMELIWAIVAQEDNGSYAGALAVISSAMNRTESANWKYCGSNALAQLTAPGQYCYSMDNYWRARLNGNVPSYVKQAVNDCLKKGIRNHAFTSFRSTKGSQTGASAVQIGGNWFFGS